MPITSASPYLFFDGTAEQAIKLYESALGAKTMDLMRYSEMPGKAPEHQHKDRIMHSTLQIGGSVVQVSDTMPGNPAAKESNIHVLLDFDDAADQARAFDALAAGGKVLMALHDAFWGATFGVLIDRFGIQWMFHCAHKKA